MMIRSFIRDHPASIRPRRPEDAEVEASSWAAVFDVNYLPSQTQCASCIPVLSQRHGTRTAFNPIPQSFLELSFLVIFPKLLNLRPSLWILQTNGNISDHQARALHSPVSPDQLQAIPARASREGLFRSTWRFGECSASACRSVL